MKKGEESGAEAGVGVGSQLFCQVHGGCVTSCCCLCASRDTWSSTEVQPMRDRRSFPCAAVWEDEMYVMGGYDGNDTLRSVECFNFNNGSWSNVPPMSIPRSNAGAAVFNMKIYLVAGWDGISLNSVECYDISTRDWSRLPPLTRCTTGVRCCFVSFRSSGELKPRNRASSRGHSCIIC